jgi:hypothetical protein
MLVGGIWKNKNFRKNVKNYAKISGKNKNKKLKIFKMVQKDFFYV